MPPQSEKGDRQRPSDLSEMLDDIDDAARGDGEVSFGDIYTAIGTRSFGPLLLLAGLIVLMPVIGDIPGVPTIMGLVVVLIAAQLLLQRDCFWLPRWVLDRSARAKSVRKGVRWLRKPARWIDKVLKPRLHAFVTGYSAYAIAATSLLIGLAQPFMEFVPFSANAAGAVLTGFGLSLIARDGLLALLAFAIAALTGALVVYGLLT